MLFLLLDLLFISGYGKCLPEKFEENAFLGERNQTNSDIPAGCGDRLHKQATSAGSCFEKARAVGQVKSFSPMSLAPRRFADEFNRR